MARLGVSVPKASRQCSKLNDSEKVIPFNRIWPGSSALALALVFIYYDSANGATDGQADGDVALKREMGSIRCQSWSRTICQSDKWPGHCVGPRIQCARTPQHQYRIVSC